MPAFTLFQHLIGGFRNQDLRKQVADLLGVTLPDYTPNRGVGDFEIVNITGVADFKRLAVVSLLAG
jgi:hypothetical protein